MEEAIIGREREQEILKRLLDSDRPEFLALYGRRRVGKTFLISEYFEGKGIVLEIVGAIDASVELQLARFSVELANAFPDIEKDRTFGDWDDAMRALVEAVDGALQRRPGQKVILFFDEIPWLDRRKSGFLSALDYAWNKHFRKTKYSNVLIVICGSAASWMIKKVINSKGGLHNRVTETIRLAPFSLGETKRYLESRNVSLDHLHIVELYMALGGIPAYLRLVKPGLSSAQVINEVCFTKGKYLTEEFDRLYSSLFAKHHNHVKIVRALASAPKGLTRERILEKTGLSDGGVTSLFLRELTESGFVDDVAPYGKKKRGRFYRLSDEYSLFYLKWIEPAVRTPSMDINGSFWLRQSQRPSWRAWSGYAFEGICLKHVSKIKDALGISGVATREGAWRCAPDPKGDERGAEIDLVIDRADKTINICELKFVGDEFEITADYKLVLDQKKRMFRKRTGTRSLVLLTMITSCGVKVNKNYTGTVANQIKVDSLF